MGSVDQWGDKRHTVVITKPFLMAVHPVTQGQYFFMNMTNPSVFSDDAQRPVENIRWREAIVFCNRMSHYEHLPPYYNVEYDRVTIVGGSGYRLPTEAEWEYACRAGSVGAYCFGDDENQLDQYAWFEAVSTYPVGKKKPNVWGLYDMHGNVQEWCWDWYAEYPVSPQENPS